MNYKNALVAVILVLEKDIKRGDYIIPHLPASVRNWWRKHPQNPKYKQYMREMKYRKTEQRFTGLISKVNILTILKEKRKCLMDLSRLIELEAKANDGRGVGCVKDILYYLGRGERQIALGIFIYDGDKIGSYPEIEAELRILLNHNGRYSRKGPSRNY